MRRFWLSCVCFWLFASASAHASPPQASTNAVLAFQMRDQFGNLQRLTFPGTNLVVLTIADRKGSEQVNGWVEAIRHELKNGVSVRGIADLSSVPAPLRSFIMKRFKKSQEHPVMLDWSGHASRHFGALSNQVNVLLLDTDGRVLERFSGPTTSKKVAKLKSAVQRGNSARP